MKVTITHLKAPWPKGAQPGHVVEVEGDSIPAWAVNKCTPAPDDAEVYAPAGEPMESVAGNELDADAQAAAAAAAEEEARIAAALADADAQAARERAAIEAKGKKKG